MQAGPTLSTRDSQLVTYTATGQVWRFVLVLELVSVEEAGQLLVWVGQWLVQVKGENAKEVRGWELECQQAGLWRGVAKLARVYTKLAWVYTKLARVYTKLARVYTKLGREEGPVPPGRGLAAAGGAGGKAGIGAIVNFARPPGPPFQLYRQASVQRLNIR